MLINSSEEQKETKNPMYNNAETVLLCFPRNTGFIRVIRTLTGIKVFYSHLQINLLMQFQFTDATSGNEYYHALYITF